MIPRIISIILSLGLVTASAVSGMQADISEQLCFAAGSDLHYNEPVEELTETNPELLDDPVFWYANRRAALENESGFIIDEFLKQCAENDDIEFVLLAGDLADDGKIIRKQHEDVAAKLEKFEQKTGKQVYVINGNHDASLNKGDTSFDDFISIYRHFGYDEAIDTLKGTCSYTADLGEKYRLIALDSCSETKSTEDGMTLEKINWVKSSAKKAYDDGRYPILMMHHNILEHMPLQRIISHNFIVRFHNTTAEIFADAGIKFVITGHEHCSDATSFTSALGNTITDFSTTSLSMFPLAYRVFRFSEKEISYELKTIDKIDTDALTQATAGYTDEMISLMNENANEYSKQFLKAGVEYRLKLGLTMEKIGIKEGEPFYRLVSTAVGSLCDTLDLPLYSEGGLQEKAKKYNINLPGSEYENGWDLATELVAWHYAGCEDFPLDSTEVTLFLGIVNYILRDTLSEVGDEALFTGLNSILANFGLSDGISAGTTKLFAKIFGPVTAVEYVLLGIASPIIERFANDDEVDDNNGSIAGYGTVSAASQVANTSVNFFSTLGRIFINVGYFFRYFIRIFSFAAA
ncbi:MAG: metallophosphoesterase [Clostridia bacterium]|nr:metallophosphoesterase [Clostridia bacterium]